MSELERLAAKNGRHHVSRLPISEVRENHPQRDEPTAPPTTIIEPRVPFPVSAFPEPAKTFIDAGSAAIGCDPSYIALPILVTAAAAIGNTRRLRLKRGWTVPSIVWGAVVGESGTAKTPAFRLAMKLVREKQSQAFEQHVDAAREYETAVQRYEKDLTAWKKSKTSDDPPEKPEESQPERYYVSDTTVEALARVLVNTPRGLLLARDELSGWIGSFDRYAGGKGDAPHWLSMFNGENLLVDRKTGGQTIHIPSASVSVVGCIQPSILNRAIGAEHRESGLLARFLLTSPPRQPKAWSEADVDPESEEALKRLFGRLYALQPDVGHEGEWSPAIVELTEHAKEKWVSYYNTHNREQVELTDDLAAAWSKLEEYAARLALVLHLVAWAGGDTSINPGQVDANSIQSGITLTEWFKTEARRVYSVLGESLEDRDRRRLMEWIEGKGAAVTARQVQQGCRWLRGSGAAERALQELVNADLGIWRPSVVTGAGGRPAHFFVLSTSTVNMSTKPRFSP